MPIAPGRWRLNGWLWVTGSDRMGVLLKGPYTRGKESSPDPSKGSAALPPHIANIQLLCYLPYLFLQGMSL